jgi:hypothetical protein
MNDDSERAWYPKVNGRYVRVTRTRGGLFVSSLVRGDRGDARPLTRGERLLWLLLRRPPKSV